MPEKSGDHAIPANPAGGESSAPRPNRVELAISAAGVGYWDWDVPSGQVVWAPSLEVMHGYEPGSFGGTIENFMATIHEDDLDDVRERIEVALSGGDDAYEIGYRFVRLDGSIGNLVGRGTILRGSSGEPLEMTGVAVDVTASVRSARQNESLLEYMGRLMAAIDPDEVGGLIRSLGPEAADVDVVEVSWELSDRTFERFDIEPAGLLRTGEIAGLSNANELQVVGPDTADGVRAAVLDVDTPTGSGRIALGWRSTRDLDDDHLRFLELFARQSIWAISQISDYVQHRHMALTLQQALQSEIGVSVPGLAVSSAYRPAADAALIGGDWFDVVAMPAGAHAFVVGDVVGHGMEAAAWSAAARHTIRTTLATTDVDGALPVVDEVLSSGPDRFVSTVLIVVYCPDRKVAQVHSAGHPPPVVRRRDGSVELVELRPGPPFGHGLWDSVSLRPAELELFDGDVVVTYTDGAIERTSGTVDTGIGELLRTISEHESIADLVHAVVELNESPEAPIDDTIALAFEIGA